jgi:hypothetical protein
MTGSMKATGLYTEKEGGDWPITSKWMYAPWSKRFRLRRRGKTFFTPLFKDTLLPLDLLGRCTPGLSTLHQQQTTFLTHLD